MPIFTFADDANWNEERRAVEFGVEVGEYQGRVFVPRAVFQSLLRGAPTPDSCLLAFHQERVRFERATEAKIVARQLDEDGNIKLDLADVRSSED